MSVLSDWIFSWLELRWREAGRGAAMLGPILRPPDCHTAETRAYTYGPAAIARSDAARHQSIRIDLRFRCGVCWRALEVGDVDTHMHASITNGLAPFYLGRGDGLTFEGGVNVSLLTLTLDWERAPWVCLGAWVGPM